MTTTVTICALNDCNMPTPCEYCIAGCNGPHSLERVDFGACIEWLEAHRPGCNVHISGGEPLLLDNLCGKTKSLLSAGHKVSIFTNTILLRAQRDLADLNVSWHLTHHPLGGVSIGQFLKSCEVVAHRPHVMARVFYGREALNNKAGIESQYPEKLYWMNDRSGYHNFYCNKPSGSPDDEILLIGVDGQVHHCSQPRYGSVGNVYDNTFNAENSCGFRCPSGIFESGHCQAYQSAIICEGLK